LETVFEPEETRAIYQRLLRQETMLYRILDELERVQTQLSSRAHTKTEKIRNRGLRILRTILEHEENANITQITRSVEADVKTVRKELERLAQKGFILYMTGNRRSNPGRRGNHPKLTNRGRKIAEEAFKLDQQKKRIL